MTWKRFVFASDLHGDMQDKVAVKGLLDFIAQWKPQIRVFGGDLWDFRALRKKADAEERRDSMVADYAAGCEFLEKFKPHFFLRGNHDERLYDLSKQDNGIISDYAMKCVGEIEDLTKALHCRMLPYDKRLGVLRLGHLKMIHGFYTGVTAARRTALAYGSVIMGHGHGIDHASIEGIDFRMGRMCGCLCDLNMPYARASIAALRHAHGFIYGVVNERTGEFHCQQAQRIGNQWSHEVFSL